MANNKSLSLPSRKATRTYLNGWGRSKVPRARYVCKVNTQLCSLPLILGHTYSQIYAGLTFRILISFPANYPYVAPTLKFDTPCYHPNVDISGGAICLDILQVCIMPVLFGLYSHTRSGQMVSSIQRSHDYAVPAIPPRWYAVYELGPLVYMV